MFIALHSALFSAAASCGTPQLIQQFVDFKDLISRYLLPRNKLVDPELLSNILAELSLINFSLLRNVKMLQRLNSLLPSKNCFARSGGKCFVRTWQSVTGKLHQVLSGLLLLSGDMPHFSPVLSSPPHSFQKKVFIPME